MEKGLRVPLVLYADFESILKPIDGNNPSPNVSYTREYQLHEPMSYCVYVKSSFSFAGQPTEPYIYRGGEGGADVAEHFVHYLMQIVEAIRPFYERNEIMQFDETDAELWNRADRCYLCDKLFENDKVRDHCHLTGKFRGAAFITSCLSHATSSNTIIELGAIS